MNTTRSESESRQRRWQWQGVDENGQVVQGETLAASRDEVVEKLTQQRILIRRARAKRGLSTGKVKHRDITVLARQMATLLRAGVPVLQGLQAIAEGVTNPALRWLINDLRRAVSEGASVAEAMARHPRHFAGLFVHLVAAGEQSGTLDRMLERVALHKEKSERLRSRVRKALWYPAMVMLTGISVAALLLVKVVPRFESMFSDFGAELPALTRLALELSDMVRDHWPWGLLLGTSLPALIYMAQHRSPRFATRLHGLALRLPLFGGMLGAACVARYCRTLSTTVGAGVPLLEGLKSAAGATGNPAFQQAVEQVRHDVLEGHSLYRAMHATHRFPGMALQMVAIGEESGTLDQMLERIAEHYESDVDDRVDILTALLEPAVIVMLGIMVGGLVIAMYLPIFELGGAL
ncbi:type II secretion system F family protein [Halomonas sp. 18H]|nr:type II secretion system F family protein [Halomonas sp. 18H]MCW4151194.1 type II secretion system F family protein [Halomonas sp. 18H]